MAPRKQKGVFLQALGRSDFIVLPASLQALKTRCKDLYALPAEALITIKLQGAEIYDDSFFLLESRELLSVEWLEPNGRADSPAPTLSPTLSPTPAPTLAPTPAPTLSPTPAPAPAQQHVRPRSPSLDADNRDAMNQPSAKRTRGHSPGEIFPTMPSHTGLIPEVIIYQYPVQDDYMSALMTYPDNSKYPNRIDLRGETTHYLHPSSRIHIVGSVPLKGSNRQINIKILLANAWALTYEVLLKDLQSAFQVEVDLELFEFAINNQRVNPSQVIMDSDLNYSDFDHIISIRKISAAML